MVPPFDRTCTREGEEQAPIGCKASATPETQERGHLVRTVSRSQGHADEASALLFCRGFTIGRGHSNVRNQALIAARCARGRAHSAEARPSGGMFMDCGAGNCGGARVACRV